MQSRQWILRNSRVWLSALALAALWPATAPALSSDREQPISIQADRASIDEVNRVTVYQGNVEVVQGSIRIEAEQVTLSYDASKQLDKVVADGKPVLFRQRLDGRSEELRAQAGHMEYHAQQDMLHLTQEAQVWQGEDSFRGERIVYDARRSLITADGGGERPGRVNVVIQPKKTGAGTPGGE